jgi:SAM-dependent methyltransferase
MGSDAPDFAAVTARMQAAWSAGGFNRVALTIMEVAEHLVATADPAPGDRVLDVACGTGNVALVAARRFTEVVGLDFAPNLLETARRRAAAEGTDITFVEGDAQALPFEDASFDVVLSVFGVQFAPDQERAAAELLRVTRPGGTIALANWVPGSSADAFFQATSRFAPPPPGLPSPWRWGTPEGAAALLGGGADVTVHPRSFLQRFPSPRAMVDTFRESFGPAKLTYQAAGPGREAEVDAAMLETIARYDRATDGTLAMRGDYAEVVAVRS